MLDFIVNPLAGGKNGRKMKKVLSKVEKSLQERNVKYAVHKTTAARTATAMTENLIKNGATTIVVVGGDGTLHEVINGFSDFDKVTLGIIPCGTGNDFATALRLPSDPIKALSLILDGKPYFTDFMQMPTVRGLNIIGMGIDVEVLKLYEKLKKKTKFGYTKCLIKALCNFNYTNFTAHINGDAENYRSFIACVANGYRYGGGIPICPVADPGDGALDFVAVTEIKKSKLIPAFLKLKAGKVLSLKEAVHKKMTEIKIDAEKPYTVNVDGELYENIPFDVKIVSDKLRVYRYPLAGKD